LKNPTKVFENGNISHRIYHAKKQGKKGKIISVIENPNRLSFHLFTYHLDHETKKFSQFRQSLGCLSRRNGKYYQYTIKTDEHGQKKVRIVLGFNGRHLSLLPDVTFKWDSKTNKPIYRNLGKAASKRLIKVFQKFTKGEFKKFIIRHDNGEGRKNELDVYQSLQFLTYPMFYQLYQQIPKEKQRLIGHSFNSFLSCHARTENFERFVKNCFGYSNKNLIKECAQTVKETANLDIFVIGSMYRTTVPVDHYYKFAQLIRELRPHTTLFPAFGGQKKDTRAFVRCFSIKRLMGFYKECFNNNGRNDWLWRDTLHTWMELEDRTINPDWNTLQKIHDRIGNGRARRRTYNNGILVPPEPEDFELEKNIKYFADLDGVVLDNFKFVVPKSKKELLTWGDRTVQSVMFNCIGTNYAVSCRDGHYFLLGVEKDGKLCYNISIKAVGNNLDQFLGYKNSQPDPEDKKIVLEFLAQQDYIVREATLYSTSDISFPAVPFGVVANPLEAMIF
jgi:hypothetical protein